MSSLEIIKVLRRGLNQMHAGMTQMAAGCRQAVSSLDKLQTTLERQRARGEGGEGHEPGTGQHAP